MSLVLVAVPLWPTGASGQEKPTLTAADYGRFELPGRPVLSPDGRFVAVQINRVNEENELRIDEVGGDDPAIVPFGSGAAFSSDGVWLAYRIGLSPEEEEAEDAEESVGLRRVGTDEVVTFERTSSFAFSDDGLYFLVFRPGEDEGGGDLVVRTLATGDEIPLGNVGDWAWSPDGHLLAATLHTTSGTGGGVQLFDPETGALRSLDRSDSEYRQLTWREDDDDLAVLRARSDEGFEEDTHVLLVWTDLRQGRSEARSFDPAEADGFPEDMRVAEHLAPSWSDDGASVFFGIRPRERSESSEADEEAAADDAEEAGAGADAGSQDEEEVSDVQIWHADDDRIIPMQRAQERRDLTRTLLSAWHMGDDRFVQLSTDLMDQTRLMPDGRTALESDGEPYRRDAMFGRNWQDVYLIDVASGDRSRVLERVRYLSSSSPEGRYALYFSGDDWWALDTRDGSSTNLTEGLDADFADRSYDYPVEQLPPVGFVPQGWIDGDRAVLLMDEHDLWAVNLDGSGGQRLTDGASEGIEYRPVRTDADLDWFDSGQPIYLSLFGSRSKQSGYARMSLSESEGVYAARNVERLILEDASVNLLTKAEDADVYAFARERFDDSPDLFVGGADLRDAAQVTETNPFQAEYAWGRSEVVDFTSETGLELQASLIYPADYEPGRRYPMIVYTYEILSDGVHRYHVPTERRYYNYQVWSQQGYFVLQPDIVYTPREPGVSAVQAVVPAVQAVVDMGIVDPERVGLIGHSWGGYQATYIPTRTDIFAASVAGAPLTNFLSMVGAVHWGPGLPELGHWETGQARMDVPPWEDFEAHVRNSPAAFIQDLTTPMLMTFGDDDGTVDFRQGVEFYNYARRANKEFVMLVYPGEDHGLRQEVNQVDYHRRILEWFGHYLKGEPAADWMQHGVSWLERKKALAS